MDPVELRMATTPCLEPRLEGRAAEREQGVLEDVQTALRGGTRDAAVARDAAPNRHAQPATSRVRAPRCPEAHERLEHPLQIRLRDSRTLDLDDDADLLAVARNQNRSAGSVRARVLQQIAPRAAQCRGCPFSGSPALPRPTDYRMGSWTGSRVPISPSVRNTSPCRATPFRVVISSHRPPTSTFSRRVRPRCVDEGLFASNGCRSPTRTRLPRRFL